MRNLLPSLLLLLFACGCARTQTFRVVDSQSGRPLDGVQSERLEGKVRPSAMPLVLLNDLSPVEHGTTDSSGVVKFQKPGKEFAFNPTSKNPECGRAYVASTWSGATIRYPDEHREVAVKPIDGVIEVPLPKPQRKKD
jgi:hypothetical protein